MKKAINGNEYIQDGQSELYSLNVSSNAEYMVTVGSKKYNAGDNDANMSSSIKHKGSSFKNKNTWNIFGANNKKTDSIE